MTSPKEHNNFSVTDPQEMESCVCYFKKEFKIIILRNLSKIQENTSRQLNELRKTMHEKNEKFNKEIEFIQKKNQTNILEVKNTTNGMKKKISRDFQHQSQLSRRICDLKTDLLILFSRREKKEINIKRVKKAYMNYKIPSTEIIFALWEEERAKGKKAYLKKQKTKRNMASSKIPKKIQLKKIFTDTDYNEILNNKRNRI